MSSEDIKTLVEKAHRFLESSKLLLDAKDYDSSVSRVYYAIFLI